MANTTSAKKAMRKIARRTAVNKVPRSRMRGFIRKVEEAIASGDKVGGARRAAGGAAAHHEGGHPRASSTATPRRAKSRA